MSRRVIFLDIDGVLNCTASMARGVHLDPAHVQLVQALCDDTAAEVVVSSTWRRQHDHHTLHHMLWAAGLRSGIAGTTPTNVKHAQPQYTIGWRGHEVDAWLKRREGQVLSYVIFDDDSDFLDHQKPHFVKTEARVGLQYEHIRRARAILLGDR